MSLQTLLEQEEIHWAAGPRTGGLTKVYCCDLLSIAMSRVPAGGLWVTVMNNINTLAVASLCEVQAVLLAEGVQPAEALLTRAEKEQITLLTTDLPIYEAACLGERHLTD